MSNKDLIKDRIAQIRYNLELVENLSITLQNEVQLSEGEGELFRKLAFYLTPGIHNLINGNIAGSMKDLDSYLSRQEVKK